MINKLTTLYKNAIVSSNTPNEKSSYGYYWFEHKELEEWIGIPTNDISDPELILLKTLFEYKETTPRPISHSLKSEKWYQFLFLNGEVPSTNSQSIRMIQFSYSGKEIIHSEFELGLKGCFSESISVVWIDCFSGIIIEEMLHNDKVDFFSIVQTLESEFFIKPYFYVGKPILISNSTPSVFNKEINLFKQGKSILPMERVFEFEKLFPLYVAAQLQTELQDHLIREVFPIFLDDPDMLKTIKTYLETNLNVSLTAKKLYIHRNTLQYRLDKFVEKTGMNLKSFQGALTIYLACLLYEGLS